MEAGGGEIRIVLKSYAAAIQHALSNKIKRIEQENERYLMLKKSLKMTGLVIIVLSTALSLSPAFAQQRGPSYEYRCSECGTVWYKSVGGYSKCPNSGCENNKAGRGSSGVKVS